MGSVPAEPPDDNDPTPEPPGGDPPGRPADGGAPTAGIPTVGAPTSGLPLGGRALVATPTIGDDRFAHCVILVLEHDDSGALGVVLNAPGDTPVDLVVAPWAPRVGAPEVAFDGGPVGTDRALGLLRLDPLAAAGRDPQRGDNTPRSDDAHVGPAGVITIPGTAGTIGLVDLSRSPDELDDVPGALEVRVFVGYAGWSAGQLDAELEVGAWWDASVTSDDVFSRHPEGLWERVVARQDGARSLFARFTGDPSLN